MANTYTYSGRGTRWAEGDPTSEDKLNIARINVDHLHEALNDLIDTDAANGVLLSTVTATTQSANDNSTKLATTAYADAAGGFSAGDAHTWTADQTFNDNVNLTLGTGGDVNFYYDGTNAILNTRVVGNGNLGIGTATIQGWDSQYYALAIGGGARGITANTGETGGGSIFLLNNMYHDGTNWRYIIANEEASYISQDNGTIAFYRGPSTSHAADATLTPAVSMLVESTGRVTHTNTTSSNSGMTLASTSATTPRGLHISLGASDDNNTTYFFYGVDTTADRIFIYSDGDLANHDGTYGTISDVKFKQDIVDARSYWDDFKAIKYRKFRHKSDVEADPNAPYRLGLVAQEIELIFPGLVPESPDPDIVEQVAVLDEDGNPTYTEKTTIVDGKPVVEQIPIMETKTTPSGTTHKWVKSSIIEGPIMARIVQELQARVEALEAA